ncbi:hypothetical protein DFH09DRAFT_1275044 [Mycena vulgaris]|nr:hypothetical protein DFH09DRAFT_1275044 [Mycena vulgaris]
MYPTELKTRIQSTVVCAAETESGDGTVAPGTQPRPEILKHLPAAANLEVAVMLQETTLEVKVCISAESEPKPGSSGPSSKPQDPRAATACGRKSASENGTTRRAVKSCCGSRLQRRDSRLGVRTYSRLDARATLPRCKREMRIRRDTVESSLLKFSDPEDKRRMDERAVRRPVDGHGRRFDGTWTGTSVTRRPSFRQLKLLTVYIAYDRVWRVFWTRRPVDGRFRRARPSKTQSKSATERFGYPSHGTRRTGATGTAHSPTVACLNDQYGPADSGATAVEDSTGHAREGASG